MSNYTNSTGEYEEYEEYEWYDNQKEYEYYYNGNGNYTLRQNELILGLDADIFRAVLGSFCFFVLFVLVIRILCCRREIHYSPVTIDDKQCIELVNGKKSDDNYVNYLSDDDLQEEVDI